MALHVQIHVANLGQALVHLHTSGVNQDEFAIGVLVEQQELRAH